MSRRILIAGVGNIFLGDDGFGVQVAAKLATRPLPAGVVVADIGVRALHLAFDLLDTPAALLIIDAVDRGDPPGTVSLIEPRVADEAAGGIADAHGMNLATVIAAVRGLGGVVPPLLLVGCQPEFVGERMGLSPVVQAAVADAVALVERTVIRLIAEQSSDTAVAAVEETA